MKKIIAIMLAALMLLSLAACGKTTSQNQDTSADTVSGDQTASTTDNEAAASTAGKIAVVFATGGLGDKTYNDSLYAGVKNVCDTMGLQFDYSEPMDAAEYEPLLRGYAETGEYALIISLGYSQGSSVEAVAPNYPDQKFMLIDAEVDCENVACYSWRENELSYMVGVMAGMMTKSNVIGFIAAFDIYNCNMNAAGLTAGAKSVNPDVQVLVDYLGSWDDIAACKEMAIAMHDKGADIIYHAASTAGLGILEAGKENGFYTIGFDGNVNADAPDTNMASAIRLFPVAADDAIHAAMDGTFQGGSISLGCAEDACVVDAEGSNVEIPDDVWAAIDAAKAGIADGSISVPKTLEEVNG